ncbi:WhiB family transcriptional regulator [Streptomyces sp. NPDC059071]|uniref:WhiB family transcriptional regulator n=1 Tax=unclassified Streptomyces TaxID=2593676 RepID=UPI0036638954
MSTVTRRSIAPAVSDAARSRWQDSAACLTVGGDAFFGGSRRDEDDARSICRSCRVLEACLTDARKREADVRERWGIAGGLSAEQRLVLAWEERLHGRRPDLAAARELLAPWWASVLRSRHRNGYAPDEIATQLGGAVRADGITVRLVLWWLGERGSRVPARGARAEATRVIDLYGELIPRMRAMGARNSDVAAYLGVSASCLARVVTKLAEDDETEEAAA